MPVAVKPKVRTAAKATPAATPVTPAAVPTGKMRNQPTPIQASLAVTSFRLAVFGEGGVGKTSLALTFPNPLVVDTDGGLEGDAVSHPDLEGDEWSPDNWKDLNALYFYLKAQIEKVGYKTIVIDGIDTLAQFILHEATDLANAHRTANVSREQLVAAEQQDYNKVWAAMDIFLNNQLKALSRSHGTHIVLTSGVREPDVEKGRMKRTFDVQPAVEGLILKWANVYGELEVVTKDSKEHRVLRTATGDARRKGKSRWAALRPGVVNPTYEKMRAAILAARDDTDNEEVKK